MSPRKITKTRRYDLDWLRSLAFILLIFYHIGMFYVSDWGWHVKSAYQSEFLQNIMLMVNRWRMPLIFLISGMAISLIEDRISRKELFTIRFLRLFIPLVIAMLLIVPPQLYFQLIQQEGYSGSYLHFLSFYLNFSTQEYPQHQHGPLGLFTWNHLWYLAYLFCYTLIYIVIKPLLARVDWQKLFGSTSLISIILFLTLLMSFYTYFLSPIFPKTYALFNDWYNHASFFSYFIIGYILVNLPLLWQKIIHHYKFWVIAALLNYVVILVLLNGYLGHVFDYFSIKLIDVEQMFFYGFSITIIWTINTIFWLLTIISLAGKFLNKNKPILNYLNEAVLPWYILHQTITIIAAMWLGKYSLGGFYEPLSVITITFIGCAFCYEIIKRYSVTRFMFGMKLNRNFAKK